MSSWSSCTRRQRSQRRRGSPDVGALGVGGDITCVLAARCSTFTCRGAVTESCRFTGREHGCTQFRGWWGAAGPPAEPAEAAIKASQRRRRLANSSAKTDDADDAKSGQPGERGDLAGARGRAESGRLRDELDNGEASLCWEWGPAPSMKTPHPSTLLPPVLADDVLVILRCASTNKQGRG